MFGKEKSVCLMYDLSDHDIGLVADLAVKLKTARDEITSTMSNVLDLDIFPVGSPHASGLFFVDLREKQPQSLSLALKRLFVTAGTPTFVRFDSGFPIVEAELKTKNKRLIRRLQGSMVGKWVVDPEK